MCRTDDRGSPVIQLSPPLIAGPDELREIAKQEGMRTLKQDGIEKIFQGRCDLKQVLTVSSV